MRCSCTAPSVFLTPSSRIWRRTPQSWAGQFLPANGRFCEAHGARYSQKNRGQELQNGSCMLRLANKVQRKLGRAIFDAYEEFKVVRSLKHVAGPATVALK